ncbi:MAG: ferric reductase-like transmembrane domain-containing protein [Pseudomonadota bacterium]
MQAPGRAFRSFLPWAALLVAVLVPLAIAAQSPLLQWRQPVYIFAGFAGVIGLGLLLIQPLLIAGQLPGIGAKKASKVHAWTGSLLLVCVIVHVGGLFITSPPDVVDALLFRSPTPFSAWGVIAMWTVFAAAVLALFRKRLALRVATWRVIHTTLAIITVAGTALHAVLIEGTMGTVSKWVLCALVLAALGKVVWDRGAYSQMLRRLRQPARAR